jgi:NADPH:quinone reductase-like Zn-dependent oxidoreductase
MKVMTRTRFGPPEDVLRLKEVATPAPAADQVLVKVSAAALNKSDWYELNLPLFIRLVGGNGIRRLKSELVGGDIAGRAEAVGESVTRFRPGDEVFGVGRWGLAEFAVNVNS